MTATYEKIATTTLGSAATEVNFTSISGSYTDLILIMSGNSTTGNVYESLQVNSDTGSNYSRTYLSGDGSITDSGRNTSQTYFRFDAYSRVSSTGRNINIINFNNYSNSTTYKTFLARSNNSALGTDAVVGLWRSTSAITSIRVFMDTSTWISGSTFTLYGIKSE
jgi:hypothetical protein